MFIFGLVSILLKKYTLIQKAMSVSLMNLLTFPFVRDAVLKVLYNFVDGSFTRLSFTYSITEAETLEWVDAVLVSEWESCI